VPAPAAAGSAFDLGCAVHSSGFCFFILWEVFAFAVAFAFRQAAIFSLAAASALMPVSVPPAEPGASLCEPLEAA
jgi:hypothetical protein